MPKQLPPPRWATAEELENAIRSLLGEYPPPHEAVARASDEPLVLEYRRASKKTGKPTGSIRTRRLPWSARDMKRDGARRKPPCGGLPVDRLPHHVHARLESLKLKTTDPLIQSAVRKLVAARRIELVPAKDAGAWETLDGEKETGDVCRLAVNRDADGLPTLDGWASADWFKYQHGIPQSRLSEAAKSNRVRTERAPKGYLDSQGRIVRTLYNEADVLRHCKPKRVKKTTRRKMGL